MQADIAFLDIFEKRRMRDAELRRGGSCRDVSVLILAVETVESLGKGFQSPSSGILCIRDLLQNRFLENHSIIFWARKQAPFTARLALLISQSSCQQQLALMLIVIKSGTIARDVFGG